MELTVNLDILDGPPTPATQTRKDVLDTYESLPLDGVPRAIQESTEASALGDNAIACGVSSVANGPGSLANDDQTTVVGHNASAQVKNGTVIGQASRMTKYGGTMIGRGSVSNGYNGISVGRDNKIAHDDVVLIGNELESTADDEILIAAGTSELKLVSGVLYVNGVAVGGTMTPNFAETGSATPAISALAQNVWSAWAEAIAATTNEGISVLVAVYPPKITASTVRLEVQLGMGGAGSEASFPGSHLITANQTYSADDLISAVNLSFPYTVPAGSRISARARFVTPGAVALGDPIVTVTILEVV